MIDLCALPVDSGGSPARFLSMLSVCPWGFSNFILITRQLAACNPGILFDMTYFIFIFLLEIYQVVVDGKTVKSCMN